MARLVQAERKSLVTSLQLGQEGKHLKVQKTSNLEEKFEENLKKNLEFKRNSFTNAT